MNNATKISVKGNVHPDYKRTYKRGSYFKYRDNIYIIGKSGYYYNMINLQTGDCLRNERFLVRNEEAITWREVAKMFYNEEFTPLNGVYFK